MANRPLRSCVCALTLSIPTVASSAAAQDVPPLTETSTYVHVRFRSGCAEVEETHVVFNPADDAQELERDATLPHGRALVGLATSGPAGDLKALLVPNQLAREAYEDATGLRPGAWNHRDPAIATMSLWGDLTIQVFPIPPKETKKISYRWVAPTRWSWGVDELELWSIPSPYRLVVDAAGGTASLASLEGEVPAREGGDTVSGEVKIKRLRPDFFQGASGGVNFLPLSETSGRAWVRAHFELAPMLEAVPSRSALVVVVDVSRSMSNDDLRLAEKLADLYIEQHQKAGHARVAVVAFDRKVHPWTPGWVDPELGRAALATGFASRAARAHGSNLHEALRVATTWLAAADDDVEKRILVLSDGKLSRTTAAAFGALPRRTVLHAVRLLRAEGDASLAVESGPLAGLAEATGGLSWLLRGDPNHLADLGFQVDAVVRSQELLEATLRAPGLVRKVGSLPEGEGVTLDEALPATGRQVVLEGRLWSRPFRWVAREDPRELPFAAALASISAAEAQRSPDEVTVLARMGNAVSLSTALLALEPGARAGRHGVRREPDFEGFLLGGSWEDSGPPYFGLQGVADLAVASTAMFFPLEGAPLSTAGEGSGPGTARTHALTVALRRAAAACDAHGPLSARIESTGEEIVNVEAEPCLAEALWQQASIPADDAPERAVTSVSAAVL